MRSPIRSHCCAGAGGGGLERLHQNLSDLSQELKVFAPGDEDVGLLNDSWGKDLGLKERRFPIVKETRSPVRTKCCTGRRLRDWD